MSNIIYIVGLGLAAIIFRKQLQEIADALLKPQKPKTSAAEAVEDMRKCPACGVFTPAGQPCQNPRCVTRAEAG